ncbi:MAG: outer membrane porin, OprD family [Burkholderiales bacterium]|nr:outer membrane porin, OprD family [Burkholderiales bacterium]
MNRALRIAPCAWVAALGFAAATPAFGQDAAAVLKKGLVDESAITVHFRSYYFDRQKPDDTQSAAWAAGGWLGYESGWVGGWLRLGAFGYTSQPIWAPDDKDGTLLLKPGQEGYTVLGQAYGAIKVMDQVFTGYRQYVNEPEVNPQDNRMTPNTFEGYTLGGSVSGIRYFGGYLTKMKTRNADTFRNFASVAGAAQGGGEGMWLAGVKGAPAKDLDLRLSYYQVPNILASTYADAAWITPLGGELKLRLGAQGMYQTSVGADNLTGSAFDTWSAGAKADLVRGPATLSIGYTQTGKGYAYQSPYGSWPGYTSMIVKDFDRAGEKAWLIGGVYDFAALNLPGMAITAYAALGSGAIDSATGAALSDNNEYDFTLDYRFSSERWPKWARPFWIRARAARVEEDFAGTTSVTNDYRIIVNYEWVFK